MKNYYKTLLVRFGIDFIIIREVMGLVLLVLVLCLNMIIIIIKGIMILIVVMIVIVIIIIETHYIACNNNKDDTTLKEIEDIMNIIMMNEVEDTMLDIMMMVTPLLLDIRNHLIKRVIRNIPKMQNTLSQ